MRLLKSIGGNPELLLFRILKDFGLVSYANSARSKLQEEALKGFRLKHIQGLVDSLEEAIIENLVKMCLPCYKEQMNKEDEEKLLTLIKDSGMDYLDLTKVVGRYIVRVLSSEANGEMPTAMLFDEVCANDEIIPGIERLWPPAVLSEVRDGDYYDAA